jgi:tRNA G18 (ribose-2'-O)-methylase SpoU
MEILCNELVTIPMANGMDSLNVAASAAIAFWELWRDGLA